MLDRQMPSLMRLKLTTLIADEAHFAKNPDSQRSRALYHLSRTTPGLILLTGTPIVNTKEELDNLVALYGKRPLLIRRLLEDVAPDIPPKKRAYLYVQLRPKAQREYDRAADDFEEWLRAKKEHMLGEGRAESSIERAMAAEAFIKVGYLRRLVAEAKVPAAADWISRAVRVGEPVVVFLEHQAVLKKLRKSLKRQRIRHLVIEGKTSPKKRHKYIEQFQAHQYPVILCSKAGKEGITLTAARHLLFVERFYTSADEEQAEDRIRRIGQTHPTTIWYLHANGTIDERLDMIVRAKRRLIRDTLRAENTAEDDMSNVKAMLARWSDFIVHGGKKRATTRLGLGKPMPPLPSPSISHAVVFSGPRWKKGSAAAWCKMHGYQPQSAISMDERLKLVVHPLQVFRQRLFRVVPICEDVKVIIGERLEKKDERMVRRQLHYHRR
jgi:SNF2 family DNA or RNA helicase